MKVIDLTNRSSVGYDFAKFIDSSNFSNITVFEFHKKVSNGNPEGFEAFRNRCDEEGVYSIFVPSRSADHYPSEISLLIKADDTLIYGKDCAWNNYLGDGSGALREFRKSCLKKNICVFFMEEDIDEWMAKNISKTELGGLVWDYSRN